MMHTDRKIKVRALYSRPMPLINRVLSMAGVPL
jgi:hypothetical protein